MRFSLRTLLLMFPAFLLAWFLAAMIYSQTRGMGHPKWIDEHLYLRSLQIAGSSMWARKGQPIDVDQVNAWLAGKIFYNDPEYREFANILPPYRMNDLHDQPYRCVALDQNKQTLPEAKASVRLGFYSLGKDGKSATFGLDPDDLNSWEKSVHPYHLQQSNLQHQIKILEIIPFTLAGVLVMGWIWFGKGRMKEVSKDNRNAV